MAACVHEQVGSTPRMSSLVVTPGRGLKPIHQSRDPRELTFEGGDHFGDDHHAGPWQQRQRYDDHQDASPE